MAAEALRVLAHVAALGARLRRRDEVREDPLVASDRSLENRERERLIFFHPAVINYSENEIFSGVFTASG